MDSGRKQRRHYSDVLEHLKTYFPSPVSDPIMDGYFVHSISKFLDQVDGLKSAMPLLGANAPKEHYQASQETAFPEDMSSVEAITALLADYCQGHVIWSHPNAQANVISPPTISSITAVIAAAIYKPNLVSDEYSARFAEAEIQTGPVTLFRGYPLGTDAESVLYRAINDPDYREQLLAHNDYNRRLFDAIYRRVMQGEGVLLSLTSSYRHF